MVHKLKHKVIKGLYNWANRLHENSSIVMRQLSFARYFLDYEQRDSDIYVCTYLKSGTTWMQVILYNLLSDGGADFDHIYDVSPWIRNEASRNIPVERVNELPDPRIIKSHDKYDFFSDGVKGRFIHVYRDGKDVALSLFHHMRNYRDPDLTFNLLFDEHFVKGKDPENWFLFSKAWMENKNNLPIHYVSYESLSTDFEATLEGIASFLNVPLTTEKLERIKHFSSFEFMKTHQDKFGERPSKNHRLIFNNFIREGKVGKGATTLNKGQQYVFDAQFEQIIAPLIEKIKR